MVKYLIPVSFRNGGMSGVEIVSHFRYVFYANIVWEKSIKGPLEVFGGVIPRHNYVHYLTMRMNARVSSARSINRNSCME